MEHKKRIDHQRSRIKISTHGRKFDIAFITETDTKALNKEEDYQISGYKTVFPKRKNVFFKIRIIAFVNESISSQVINRSDLMSDEFPSIWLEIGNQIQKNTIVGGFYRQFVY